MAERKQIIMIGPVYPYKGGISHYTGMMYRELAKKHDVIMISYKKQYPKILFKREQRDFKNDNFKVENTKYLINTANPINIISVARWIKRYQPDMVIIQWWHPYFAPCYRILTTFMGKQNITFVCHNVLPHERFPLDKWLTKLTLKKGKNFILHAYNEEVELDNILKQEKMPLLILDDTQAGLSEKPRYRKRVTPHPTYDAFKFTGISKKDARDKLGIRQEEKILLFFGFVREYKGLGYLIEAMPKIIRNLTSVKLLVVGDFDENKDIYMHQIEKLELNDYVIVKDGYLPDREVEPYFVACDLVMLPYLSATQSGIAQIAFGFTKPVIATNVGGLPDVIRDGKTGYLVEPRNSEQLAQAVITYYKEKKQKAFEQYIKQEAYRFSWERMGEVIDDFFLE